VQHLEDEVGFWAQGWNEDPKPLIRKTPAKEIIVKVRRGLAIVLGRFSNKLLEGFDLGDSVLIGEAVNFVSESEMDAQRD
jgi:hypothetical protein